jgi:hypothetical protein
MMLHTRLTNEDVAKDISHSAARIDETRFEEVPNLATGQTEEGTHEPSLELR